MTTRREFLKAAAASALPVVVAAMPLDRGPSLPRGMAVRAVLIDARHAHARTVGERLVGSGASVLALPVGDVTRIWLDTIGPAWKREALAVAGLTERPALFCLEQLAFECGLRVVFHGEHVLHPGGQTEHRLVRGAAAAGLAAPDLNRAGPRWPALIAAAIATYREPAYRVRVGPSEAALGPALPPRAQLLTSWIIAPV